MVKVRAHGQAMLVAVSVLAVCCATTSVLHSLARSGRNASLPNHFEAVGLDSAPVHDKDRARLERAFLNNENLSVLYLFRKDCPSTWMRIKPSRVWRRCAMHPYLAELFPGVEFYSVEFGEVNSGDWSPRTAEDLEAAVAVKDSSCYLLPYELNQLMVDAGWRLGSTDIERWVRVYALLWAMMKRGVRSGKAIRGTDEYWSLPFFPEVDMEDVHVEWYDPMEAPLVSASFRMQDGSTTKLSYFVTGAGSKDTYWLIPIFEHGVSMPGVGEGRTTYFLKSPRTKSSEKDSQ
jgi:hypothetical protein